MATKRKSIEVLEFSDCRSEDSIDGHSTKENDVPPPPPPTKKARLSSASEAPEGSSTQSKGKGKGKASEKASAPTRWQDVVLETDNDGSVPVFDDCAEVRRKIRALLQTPGFKITAWLREIGNINSNSYGRFMKEKGRNDGASNGTYYSAYCYFEKVRIAEGKKKTAGRTRNESEHPFGFPLERARGFWGPS